MRKGQQKKKKKKNVLKKSKQKNQPPKGKVAETERHRVFGVGLVVERHVLLDVARAKHTRTRQTKPVFADIPAIRAGVFN